MDPGSRRRDPVDEQLQEERQTAVHGSRAAIAGLLFSALYIAAFMAVRGLPRPSWSDEEILAYHASNEVGFVKLVALYAVPFAGIAFLWFLAAFRHHVHRLAGSESMLLSTVQILTGAIYVTLQFCAAASIVTVVLTLDDAGTPTAADIDAVRPFLMLGDTILVVFALRAAAVFMITGTTRALRSGLFPRWYARVSYALALVLVLTIAQVRAVTLVFPLWIAVASILVLVRRQRLLEAREACAVLDA